MFDKNLMQLDGMGAVMGALVVLALVQAAGIGGQAWALSGAIAALWAGANFASQAPLVGAFAACFALVQVARFAQDAMLDARARTAASELRGRLLQRALDARGRLVAQQGEAHVTTSATEGVDQVEAYVRIIPPKLVGMVAISIPLLVFCFFEDAVSGVLLAIMFPVIIFFMVLLGRRARARAESQYESYTRLSNRFMDTLRGIDAIEALGAGEAEGCAVWSFSEKLRQATIRTLSTATLSSAVLDLCTTFGVAAVAIMLAFRLMDGSMLLGPALCALMLAPEYFQPIRAFASDFHASLDGKNALADILRTVGDGCEKTDRRTGEEGCEGELECELEFENAAFAYAGAAAPAVSGVNLALHPGEHVALVGPSGSGKSTLAALAAGLISPDGGTVRVRDSERVRFVPQQPHVFSASLLDNVRFYAPDATREQALYACRAMGLDELLSELPRGIDTRVGEGGRGLSGGQAHRVALARILLDEDAQLLVFDEPTAHLDVETERELKERILPLLEGKTVLFATHRLHWTDSMDRVVVLENGRIADVRAGGRSAESDARNTEAGERLVAADAPECSHDSDLGARRSESVPAIRFIPSSVASVDATRNLAQATESRGALRAHGGRMQDSTDGESASGDFSTRAWIASVLKRYRRHVGVALALGALAGGFASLLMFASGYLISATAQPNATLFSILLPVAFVQVFGLGRPVARYLERLVSHDWVFKVTSDLRRRLFDAMRAHAGDPARARAASEYLAVLDDDIAHVQNLYLRTFFPAAIAGIVALGAVVLFGAFSLPAAACAALVLALACAGIPLVAFRSTRVLSQSVKDGKTAAYAAVGDDVAGSLDWTLSRRAPEALAKHARADRMRRADGGRLRLRVRTFELASSLVMGASVCALLAWGASAFSGVETNWIAAFALGVFPMADLVASLPSVAASSTEHLTAVRRIAQFIGENDEESASATDSLLQAPAGNSVASHVSAGNANQIPAGNVFADAMTATRSNPKGGSGNDFALDFDSVRYRYPAAGTLALDDFMLQIPLGKTVAVLGRSGAGKSTFAQLARGRMRPSGGTVRACGLDAWENRACMHGCVGFLSQDPHVFDRSLRDNLRLGAPEADDGELAKIMESVGLGEALARLPKGLDTMVGQTGVGFSGGEAHRVALARVLAANTSVLIVDEPFSALDPQTEAALMEMLLSAAQGRTLVVVTHHLAHVGRFDRVVFVEDGKVTLDGAPDELARESAYFHALMEFDR